MLTRPGYILVADHQGSLDRFVCDVVGQEHWLIRRVDSLQELEEQLQVDKPDIIILNSHLRNLQVVTFSEAMTARFGNERPYIILAINKEVDRFMQRGVQVAVDEVLIAPFYGVELLTKVHNFLRMQKPQSQRSARTVEVSVAAPQAPVQQYLAQPAITVTHAQAQHQRIETKPKPAAPITPFAKIKTHLRNIKQITPIPAVKDRGERTTTPVSLDAPNNVRTLKPQQPEPVSMPIHQGPEESSVRKRMTLLLIRINGLEPILDDFSPQDSVRLLFKIYDAFTAELKRLGGQVTTKHGDSLVCLFTNSAMYPNHRISAIQAAMQLQITTMFLGENIAPMAHDISLNCVIHTAMMTVGTQKTADLSPETTVVGSALPLAMSLLEHCPRSGIIATKECYNEIKQYVCVSKEFTLQNESHAKPLQFGLLSAINTKDVASEGSTLFKAS